MAIYTPSAFTSTAVQTACDAAYAAGGGVVYCAAGIYSWTSTLTIRSAVQVIGDGYGNGTDGVGTVFKQAGSTNLSAMVVFYRSPDGVAANAHNAGLHRVRLDGSKSTNTTTATDGIQAITNPLWTAATSDNSSVGWDMHNSVTDVHVWYCKGNGFKADGRSEMNISRTFIRECDGHGFWPSADTNLSQCVAGVNGLAGFYLGYQGSIRLTACKAWYSGQVTAAQGHGFWLQGINSGSVVLSGCEAQDNKAAGYFLDSSYACEIQGAADSNSTSGAGSYPALLISNSYGSKCDVVGVDRAGTPTQTYGLKITGSEGNKIYVSNRWLTNPTTARSLDPTSTTTKNTIDHVYLNGTTATWGHVTG